MIQQENNFLSLLIFKFWTIFLLFITFFRNPWSPNCSLNNFFSAEVLKLGFWGGKDGLISTGSHCCKFFDGSTVPIDKLVYKGVYNWWDQKPKGNPMHMLWDLNQGKMEYIFVCKRKLSGSNSRLFSLKFMWEGL